MSTPAFRKSSHSGHSAECVEVAGGSGDLLVRDSRHPGQGCLSFPMAEWGAFLAVVRLGAL
ncbi:DUF397 domain-containing protein [Marinactinospora rubrisoli]|uniref:DUF397 domain-containing protein n=1 Tax=Marinactinospora rubrisoli TaxID=2715399 RepID=A0ABW2KCK6_9ACTN